MKPENAVIIGATSGIGRKLGELLLERGCRVGLTGRRVELLEDLKKENPEKVIVKKMDVKNISESLETMNELIDEQKGMDLFIYCAGTGFINPDLNFEQEQETIDVNVSGFVALTGSAFKYFVSQGAGNLAGISSIAALTSSGDSPAYAASKAFESSYLRSLRQKAHRMKLPIYVTDIKPGFVDTNMAQGEGLFWVEPVEKAAGEILESIIKKKKHTYITKRWGIIGFILKHAPEFLHDHMQS